MKVLDTIVETRAQLDAARAQGRTVGLVPTMGFLHAGHRSLIDRAVADCDVTLLTIFVNPLQFAPDEDLADYPRDLDQDLEMAAAAGAAVVLVPDVAEMYPEPILTTVRVGTLSGELEGASRPSHFDGVATVVSKLFNIAGPCRAYFGEKDFQQLAIVRRLAADLSFPVEVVGCPIVREPDGLAMSSRNVYLDPEDREAAVVLNRALRAGAEAIADGERSAEAVEALMAAIVAAEPRAALDYAVVRGAHDLGPVDPLAGELRLLGAAQVGRPRLIDNLGAMAED